MSIRTLKTADEPDDFADGSEAIFAEINITPLTDVILVLLIIFMVSSSAMLDAAREGRLDLSLPKATTGTAEEAAPLMVDLAQDGRITVSGETTGEDEIADTLKRMYSENPARALVLQADGELPHRKVVHIIDLARSAGFAKVQIAVEQGE